MASVLESVQDSPDRGLEAIAETLALHLDQARSGSEAASLARELRYVLLLLRRDPAANEAGLVRAEPGAVDEIARKRADRRGS